MRNARLLPQEIVDFYKIEVYLTFFFSAILPRQFSLGLSLRHIRTQIVKKAFHVIKLEMEREREKTFFFGT
jgi:hypothetical protein